MNHSATEPNSETLGLPFDFSKKLVNVNISIQFTGKHSRAILDPERSIDTHITSQYNWPARKL